MVIAIIKHWVRENNTNPKQRVGTEYMFQLISASNEVYDWITTQDRDLWIEPKNRGDSLWVDEKLIVIMLMKWPDTLIEDF